MASKQQIAAQKKRQEQEQEQNEEREQQAAERQREAAERKELQRQAASFDYELLARGFVAGQRSVERSMNLKEQIQALIGCALHHNEYLRYHDEMPEQVATAYVKAIDEMWNRGLLEGGSSTAKSER